jgi:hypothetical protein
MPMIAEDKKKLEKFLREMGDLSRRYGFALGEPSTIFVMEPEDYQTEYRCDENSVMSFG